MRYVFLIALGLMLTVSPVVVADDEEPAGVVALLCKMSRHAQLLTQTLSIDYDKKLVDGISATFTASMITWAVENGSHSEHHQLNRITGTYNYWMDDETSPEVMTTFSCEKAPPKF